MSDACLQLIDCCPPTPFDYLIPENLLFFNTEQCGAVSCPSPSPPAPCNLGVILDEFGNPLLDEGGAAILEEGASAPTTICWCIAANSYTSVLSQQDADDQAKQAAIAQASKVLAASSPCFGNQAWCCLSNCNPDGSITNVFTQINNPQLCLESKADNQVWVWVRANVYFGSSQAAADALAQSVLATINAGNLGNCPFQNQARYSVANCPNGPAQACVTVAPTPAPNISIGTVLAGTPSCNSNISIADANNKACALAQSLATQGLAGCSIAPQLTGLLWAMPCTNSVGGPVCTCVNPSPQVSTKINGTPGHTYQVTLRIRGAVELKDYYDTSANPDIIPGTGNRALKGPNASDPTIPRPGNAYPNANQYSIKIYDNPSNPPAAFYFLNNLHLSSQSTTYALDYMITVPLTTGQTVVLEALSEDGLEYHADFFGTKAIDNDPNFPIKVNQGVSGYHGQFMQMDCYSIS